MGYSSWGRKELDMTERLTPSWMQLTLFRTCREDGEVGEVDSSHQVSFQIPLRGLLLGASDPAPQKLYPCEG